MPLDPKLTKFTTAQQQVIASFTTSEFAEGTGIVKFFGYVFEDSTGKKYKMSQTPFFSREIEQALSATTSSFVTKFDIDFDAATFYRA